GVSVSIHILCMIGLFSLLFFFSSRRRHTRSKRDWSSDVCSSDLNLVDRFSINIAKLLERLQNQSELLLLTQSNGQHRLKAGDTEIGRASCRERGENLVGAEALEKKKRRERRDDSNKRRRIGIAEK